MVAIGRCGTGPLSHHSKRSKADQVCNRNRDLTLKDQLFLHVPTILVSSTRKERDKFSILWCGTINNKIKTRTEKNFRKKRRWRR
jgi:hypothetical protein